MSKHVARGRFSLFALALAIAGAVALSAPAGAQDATDEAGDDDVFATPLPADAADQPVNFACISRFYEARQLTCHKLQKPPGMKLLVTDETPQEKSSEGEGAGYSLGLGKKFRSSTGSFDR
jgi:hypothetical protein